MPHVFLMCLGLVGVLLAAIFTILAYSWLKLTDPERDPFLRMQRDMAEDVGLGGMARFGQSRVGRLITLVLACTSFSAASVFTLYQGFLAFG